MSKIEWMVFSMLIFYIIAFLVMFLMKSYVDEDGKWRRYLISMAVSAACTVLFVLQKDYTMTHNSFDYAWVLYMMAGIIVSAIWIGFLFIRQVKRDKDPDPSFWFQMAMGLAIAGFAIV